MFLRDAILHEYVRTRVGCTAVDVVQAEPATREIYLGVNVDGT